ncbi:response regulator [Phormidium sp. FACHB-592]|uniref:Response regulator n=1 Tax=Stenomitos frigidus AS-A4 TaxID=2933935 RepID=A0ABV0KRM8_9CYAN|nr:response regulator [Phormidium sp. FACHB-592]MBD2078317.1 response regulator [Phormidium sp. FACHB-592]
MAQLHHLQGVPILVLDDDPDCLALLTFALRLEGAVVSATNSVAAAQTSFLAQPPQLVVSDLAMPGTTGYDFIAWLRALSPTVGGRVPVLALTAMASEADRQQALQAGFNEHLTKPVDLELLLLVLERLLQSAQSSQGLGEPESRAAVP